MCFYQLSGIIITLVPFPTFFFLPGGFEVQEYRIPCSLHEWCPRLRLGCDSIPALWQEGKLEAIIEGNETTYVVDQAIIKLAAAEKFRGGFLTISRLVQEDNDLLPQWRHSGDAAAT